jgi:RNA polymerase sigma-70 factor (ECF subfamily)
MSRFNGIDVEHGLVARLKEGDRDAARQVYERLSGPVFSLAWRLLKDRQNAAEATQDTFVDVIEQASTLENPAALGPWVRRIAINHCLARLRSPWHRRRQWLTEGAASEADVNGNGASDASLAEVAGQPFRLDDTRDLDAALHRLSGQARFVVWMHDVEGYTHKQIATLLGKTESFSKSQLARAHARLLEWFDDSERQVDRRSNGSHRAPD